MIYLSPSVLSADFAALGQEIQTVTDAGAQWVHLDVMDGMFVPNLSFGAPVIKAVRPCTDRIFDVHLMIEEPARYIHDFAKAGADILTVHVEACEDVEKTLSSIRAEGMKAGLALNPETPVEDIVPFIGQADLILVMTVHPGFGGQQYIDECTEKIEVIHAIAYEYRLSLRIEADGGVTIENVRVPLEAGADVIVAGSAVFHGDAADNVRRFQEIFRRFEK